MHDKIAISGYLWTTHTNQFPDCDEENAISVSCLDIFYSVTVLMGTKSVDERNDKTSLVVLQNLIEEDSSRQGKSLSPFFLLPQKSRGISIMITIPHTCAREISLVVVVL